MKLILDRPIAFFDLETTGLDTEKDRIVEIAICKLYKDGSTETFKARVNPEIEIPAAAAAVHGITNEMLVDCPKWREIGPKIFDMLGHCDIGGYNSNSFDVPFLFRSFAKIGLHWDYTKFHMVDVQRIYFTKERRRLSDAVKLYLGKELEGAHDAEVDITATVDVFKAQLEKYDDLPDNVEELALFCNGGRKQADVSGKFAYNEEGRLFYSFGKHQGKEVKSELSYAQWMINKGDFPKDSIELLKKYLANG